MIPRSTFQFFRQVAGVDDECAGNWQRIDPDTVLGTNAKPGRHVLQKHGYETAILVLVAFGNLTTRITNDFKKLRWLRLIHVGKDVFRSAESRDDCFNSISWRNSRGCGAGSVLAKTRFFRTPAIGAYSPPHKVQISRAF